MRTFSLIAFLLFNNNALSEEYNVVFYSDFEPICYSLVRDMSCPDFNEARGYEVDLLKAMESVPNSNITFKFFGVKTWNGIWLKPYTDPNIDIAIGGITEEPGRMLNAQKVPVVATTTGDLVFKQSLLMKAENTIKSHADLTCAYVIGAVRGTTGEYRFLAQSNILKNLESGLIDIGVTVVLDNKEYITSDGTLSIYDPLIENRTMLISQNCRRPLVKYFSAEDTMIPALEEGHIDGIARGHIGNQFIAEKSQGKFVVTAIYSLECPKQESVTCKKYETSVMYTKRNSDALLHKLNHYIEYLTDNGKIGYEDWKQDNQVFLKKAQQYRSQP